MNNERHYLHTLFEPESIAITGASAPPNSIGIPLVRNMLDEDWIARMQAAVEAKIKDDGK